jgi:transposase-like protein
MISYLYLEALVKIKQHCKGINIIITKLSNYKCKDCYLNYAKRVLYQFPTIYKALNYLAKSIKT